VIVAGVAGLALTGIVTAILTAAWGREVLLGAVSFGLLATAIQIASAGLVRPAVDREFKLLVRRWGVGMGLRLGGIVVFAVAAGLRRDLFPPLASALAYVGVLVPLLFMEIRSLR
jgi:hypothetical protein